MPSHAFTVKFTGPAIFNSEINNDNFLSFQISLQNFLSELFQNVKNTKYVSVNCSQPEPGKFNITISQNLPVLLWLQSLFFNNQKTIESALMDFNFIPGNEPIITIEEFVKKAESISNNAAKYAKQMFEPLKNKNQFNSVIFHQESHITAIFKK